MNAAVAGPDGDRPLVEACLIVKNEESALPACLEALERLRSLVSGINVYDTGSTDATIEIAERFGARVVRGYWDGDFSRARNASLDMATSRWALIVDADETVVADPDRLRAILANSIGVDVFNAYLTHVDGTGQPIGRSAYGAVLDITAVRYHGRIHEVADRADGATTRAADLDENVLTFLHTGYATAEIRHAKAVRNAAAAQDDVAEALVTGDPERIARAQYHHGRTLLRLGTAGEEAREQLWAAWNGFLPRTLGRDRVMSVLVPALLSTDGVDAASRAVATHAASGGAPSLVRLLVGRLALESGRPADALRALDMIPAEGEIEHEVDPRDVADLRIQAFEALGRFDEALATCLVLVLRWQEVVRVPELLFRLGGQPSTTIAALLLDGMATEPPEALHAALVAAGGQGAEISALMRAMVGAAT